MHQTYQIQDLHEVEDIASHFAAYFPKPSTARLGVHELLLNALEHGNLGITYDEKTQLVQSGKWRDEVMRRLALPQYRGRHIHTHLLQSEDSLTLYIRDEGTGFDWKPYLHCSEERLRHPHGRGIALAKELCFDRLIYSQKGNEVLASVAL